VVLVQDIFLQRLEVTVQIQVSGVQHRFLLFGLMVVVGVEQQVMVVMVVMLVCLEVLVVVVQEKHQAQAGQALVVQQLLDKVIVVAQVVLEHRLLVAVVAVAQEQ
jgi:hypothetical protein